MDFEQKKNVLIISLIVILFLIFLFYNKQEKFLAANIKARPPEPNIVLQQLVSDDNYLYKRYNNGKLYHCKKPCDNVTNNWQISGNNTWLSHVASDGTNLYGINSNGVPFRCKAPCADGQWTQFAGSHLTHISSDGQNVYAANSYGIPFRCKAPCNDGKWVSIPGNVSKISSNGEHLFAANSYLANFKCKAPCVDGKWQALPPGNAGQIAADNQNVYKVNYPSGIVSVCKHPCNGEWTNIPNVLLSPINEISANNGELTGVSPQYSGIQSTTSGCKTTCDSRTWDEITS